jgi:hypothetical protein
LPKKICVEYFNGLLEESRKKWGKRRGKDRRKGFINDLEATEIATRKDPFEN